MTTDSLLVKYKAAGMEDSLIAKKLGMTIEEVRQRWSDLLLLHKGRDLAGAALLEQQYTLLCHQYSLLGESLKIVAKALSNIATAEEVRACIQEDSEESLQKLFQSFIILRPFEPVNPVESMEQGIKNTLQGN